MIIKSLDNLDQLGYQFSIAEPEPMIVVDNFLEEPDAEKLFVESQTIPTDYWSRFTRNGSYMEECTNLQIMEQGSRLVASLHSSEFLKKLEKISGIEGLIPDPHIVGGGYSKSFTGDSLKIHTDFNWNDKLKLHRALSFIIYLTPTWKSEWGGSLEFYDRTRKNCVTSIDCLFNRAVIWKYHKRGFHGYPIPLTCPENVSRTTFRVFYYISNSTYDFDDRPHRSLYWYNSDLNEPYDIPTQK